MPENNFERRVQQKMEGFQLQPSDLVWNEVNRRIHEKKRRRFIFWWLLLAFILAGGIGTAVWMNGNQEKNNRIAGNNKNETENKSSAYTPVQITPESGNTINPNHDTAVSTFITTEIESTDKPKIITSKVPADQSSPGIASVVKQPLPATQNKSSGRRQSIAAAAQPAEIIFAEQNGPVKMRKDKIVPEKKATIVSVNPESGSETAATVIKDNTDKPASTPVTVEANSITPPSAPIAQTQPMQNINLHDTAIIDSVLKVSLPSLSMKKSKWEWDISVSGGRSSVVYGFGKFKQASLMDAALGGGGGGIGGNPVPASVSLPPAKSGPSFGINVYARKAVAGNLDFILGLGYNYYSTRMKVGERVDSTRNVNNAFVSSVNVGTFYRPSGLLSGQTYTNKYHFASLSAELSWKIIRGDKFSMYWRNGLQYSQLLGSTMLHYDNAIPGYYQDNSQLKKGHLFFTTGLSVPAGKRWQFNPYFNYGLTIVLNNGESRTHYNSAGLRVIYSLPENK